MGANHLPKKNFSLRKWYLDCVTRQGDCFIFYVANLEWRGWKINYSSSLIKPEGKKAVYTSKIRGIRRPKRRDDQIRWADAQFGVNGRWNKAAPELSETLFKDDKGALVWNCLQSKSMVQLKFQDELLKGVGYAECLDLDTLPWNIPMDELRWGRFNSEAYSIVWIEYKKETTQQWVWVNGESSSGWHITDAYLLSPNNEFHLELNEPQILEAEQKIFNVLKGLFRFLPGFSGVIPKHFLTAKEQKWLSKGRLHVSGNLFLGWAIHEFVNFNEDR